MFNFLNVSDARGLWPIVALAAIGVAGWYVWQRTKADPAGASATVTAGNATTVADLALLQSLMGGQSLGGGAKQPVSMSQPTYYSTGSNAPAAAAPSTSGSSTGNTYITQGA